jgi:hypothetical protein
MTVTTAPIGAQSTTTTTGTSKSAFRTAAGAGIAFVVLDVVGTFLPGAPPASDASTAKIAAYFHDHASGIKGQLFVGTLGIVALLWWFGALWRLLSRIEDERPQLAMVAAVSLAVGVVLAIVSTAIITGAAMHAVSAETTRAMYAISLVTVAAGGIAIAVFIGASCAVLYRSSAVPRWTNYVGLLAALVFLVGGFGTVTDANAVNMLGLVAFIAWCLWILAISVVMWRTDW